MGFGVRLIFGMDQIFDSLLRYTIKNLRRKNLLQAIPGYPEIIEQSVTLISKHVLVSGD
jgi:uncharacterized protein YabN with tetrapyrrole methylase and pyrophosphatase domain